MKDKDTGIASGAPSEPNTLVEPALYTAFLEGSLVLTKHGEWKHNGVPFSHPRVSELFHRSITWDPSRSCYVVRLGPQQATFTCEDTPFFVTHLHTDTSPWTIELAGGRKFEFLPHSLQVGSENQFYCSLPSGAKARLTRSAHQALLSFAVDEASLLIDGVRVTPSKA